MWQAYWEEPCRQGQGWTTGLMLGGHDAVCDTFAVGVLPIYVCLFVFWLRWVFVTAHWLFSGCSKQGLLLSCGAGATHCRGFSCCRSWALGCSSSVVAAKGFVVLQHVESSWTRDRTWIPCIGRWILNHWTPREVPLHIPLTHLASAANSIL